MPWTTSATSVVRTPERPRARGGFTVLELLVVLGLVLALFGLTVPFMIDGLDRRRASTARDQVTAMVSRARSVARSQGIAVELVWIEAQARLVARRFEPSPAGFATEPSDPWSDSESSDDQRRLRGSWTSLALDDGIRCVPVVATFESLRSPIDGAGDFLDDVATTEDSGDAWLAETRLVVILPDGVAIRLEPFMVGRSGRELECDLDPLTARVDWIAPGRDEPDRVDPDEDEMEDADTPDEPESEVEEQVVVEPADRGRDELESEAIEP